MRQGWVRVLFRALERVGGRDRGLRGEGSVVGYSVQFCLLLARRLE